MYGAVVRSKSEKETKEGGCRPARARGARRTRDSGLFVRKKGFTVPQLTAGKKELLLAMAAMALTSVLAVGAGNCTLTGRAPRRVRLEASELPHPAARRRAPRMEVTQRRDHGVGYLRGRPRGEPRGCTR